MKTKKLSLKDYWFAKPKDERQKEFIKKHSGEVIPDANGNGDDVFQATNVKAVDRETEHGYNPGSDEKVYEAEEQIEEISDETKRSYLKKGDADYMKRSGTANSRDNKEWHKIDKRAKYLNKVEKDLKEDEQLDELSKKTLKSYVKSANISRSTSADRTKTPAGGSARLKASDKYFNRTLGISRASDRLTKEGTEEKMNLRQLIESKKEPLDEISKKTLGSYIDKASKTKKKDGSFRDPKNIWRAGDKVNKGFSKVHATNEEVLNEAPEHAAKIKKLSDEMTNIRKAHQEDFGKLAGNVLKSKGFKKALSSEHHDIYQKEDKGHLNHMLVSKYDACIRSSSTNGKTGYHHHELAHTKKELTDGVDRMIHGGGYGY